MTQPELTGALEGLKHLEVSDLPRYKLAVEAGQQMGWGYYFPYLLSRNGKNSAVLLAEDEGSMCVFLWQMRDAIPKLDLLVAPTPMNVPALERCIERANDFNNGLSARILRVDAKDVAAVSTLRQIRVKQRKTQYLFAPSSYTDLAGGKYKSIRRNVASVESLPDVEVAPYTASHADACLQLLKRWRSQSSKVTTGAGGIGSSRQAIQLAGILSDRDLRGEVVFIDGTLSAFAFGGEIRPGLGCSFDRRSDSEVRGLGRFHVRSLLLRLQDFDLVNDGSDAGRSGLRQLKESFRPVGMHAEYRASQRLDE